MINYIQSYCQSIGENGCYLFCLFDIAEKVTKKQFDVLKKSWYFVTKGWVQFDRKNYKDENNFTVLDPVAILNHLTNLKWSVRKEPASYRIKNNDYVVEFWTINGQSGHFTRRFYNSLVYSRNRDKGRIGSYRIFNIVE